MFGPGKSVDTASTVQFEPGALAEGVVHGLRERSSRAWVATAYAIPITSRYAPELLGYKPTYMSYLKKRPRQQGVPRAGRGHSQGQGSGAGRGGGSGGSTFDTKGSNSGP
ncbi:hypothetical protein RHMOL_Rhmol06G0003200 [Rhododendron molle]|uniref:Uncharacterized protein n=1 Tax=Rhododendron molle TaxID=49168 RepID=A0ACC0N8R9_RHOML|nr:hypothetical protein RHMOL_Rhmol06G0003200 [Rhododendron molle]